MPTTPRSYSAIAQAQNLRGSGKLRGDLTVRDLREAVRALAGLVFILTQHAKDGDIQTDALDLAHEVVEDLVEDLEQTPGPGGRP
mgnify:CR=1 FL=1